MRCTLKSTGMTVSTDLGTSPTYVEVVVEAAEEGDVVPIIIKEEAEVLVDTNVVAVVVAVEAGAEDVAVLEDLLLIQPILAGTIHQLSGDL